MMVAVQGFDIERGGLGWHGGDIHVPKIINYKYE
jgi:hypothetical protein